MQNYNQGHIDINYVTLVEPDDEAIKKFKEITGVGPKIHPQRIPAGSMQVGKAPTLRYKHETFLRAVFPKSMWQYRCINTM